MACSQPSAALQQKWFQEHCLAHTIVGAVWRFGPSTSALPGDLAHGSGSGSTVWRTQWWEHFGELVPPPLPSDRMWDQLATELPQLCAPNSAPRPMSARQAVRAGSSGGTRRQAARAGCMAGWLPDCLPGWPDCLPHPIRVPQSKP